MNRRNFLSSAATCAVLASIGAARSHKTFSSILNQPPNELLSWEAVRGQFDLLSRDQIHLSSFFLVSHPRMVREAIERHRAAIDANPYVYLESNLESMPKTVQAAAAEYLGGKADEVALTNSTTMGLTLVHHGLPLKAGDEVLTTMHDHFVHHEAIRLAAVRAGASVRKIALYDDSKTASAEDIVGRLKKAISPKTRVFGITWVHSSTGVKLPIKQIAAAVAEVNSRRAESDRIVTVVDGVHGFGVEDETIAETGVDFFVSGTHKWMFGPRGTGIIWANANNWKLLRMVFPAFARGPLVAWMTGTEIQEPMQADWIFQGGFHSFEYEWALPAAFALHRQIGRARVADRIHSLNEQCKEGLDKMPHVKLHTPRGNDLSAGLICFEVEGLKPKEVVGRLYARRVVASTSPYRVSYARLAPSLLNTPEEVDTTLRYVRDLA